MLRKVRAGKVKLPDLYLAESAEDIKTASENGLPYVVWTRGEDEFLRSLFLPVLEKTFPKVAWRHILGGVHELHEKVRIVEGVAGSTNGSSHKAEDINDENVEESFEREDDGIAIGDKREVIASRNGFFGQEPCLKEGKDVDIYEYVSNIHVDMDVLQELKMLPKFLGDITDCIRANFSNRMHWTEGYNKKLRCPIGKFQSPGQLPNLIIVDVSNSIPVGISSTMLMLVETMREQCCADVIITGSRSTFYKYGEKLPTPQQLRNHHKRCNEAREFFNILSNQIKGKEYGHVISFGDHDCPDAFVSVHDPSSSRNMDLSGTKVHEVHHYHTWSDRMPTGYAKWTQLCSPEKVTHDTSWANCIYS